MTRSRPAAGPDIRLRNWPEKPTPTAPDALTFSYGMGRGTEHG